MRIIVSGSVCSFTQTFQHKCEYYHDSEDRTKQMFTIAARNPVHCLMINQKNEFFSILMRIIGPLLPLSVVMQIFTAEYYFINEFLWEMKKLTNWKYLIARKV